MINPTAPAPAATPWARVGAGAALLLASLGLVGLAGCFLLGTLAVLGHWPPSMGGTSTPAPVLVLSESDQTLLRVLYTAAGACAVGALVLVVLGTAGLWRVLRSR
jgi:hypothetical protein